MATLEAFLPYVGLHCMGVPEPSMVHEIRATAILFCERSRIWKALHTLNVRANRADYEIPVEDEAVVVAIEEAIFQGNRLPPEALDVLKEQWRDWMTQTGTPLCFTQMDPDSLKLVPKPVADLTKGLSLRVSYKPDRTARNVPDWLFQQYAETIAHGAIGRLVGTRAFECFNPELSNYYLQLFAAGVNRALHEADKSFTRTPRRTVPRFM